MTRKEVLMDGNPPEDEPNYRDKKKNGQQKNYLRLSDEELGKEWVRPYRDSYTHKACGQVTSMSRKLAETYARDPKFYGATFCGKCGGHYPVEEFVWYNTEEVVGS